MKRAALSRGDVRALETVAGLLEGASSGNCEACRRGRAALPRLKEVLVKLRIAGGKKGLEK